MRANLMQALRFDVSALVAVETQIVIQNLDRVAMLNRNNLEIRNRIKDDATVARFILTYAASVDAQQAAADASTGLDVLGSVVTSKDVSPYGYFDNLALQNCVFDESVPCVSPIHWQASDIENRVGFVEVTAALIKDQAPVILYVGAATSEQPNNGGPADLTSASAVLPLIPQFVPTINNAIGALALRSTTRSEAHTIYAHPNLFTYVRVPAGHRVKAVYIASADAEYPVTIQDYQPGRPGAMETGYTNRQDAQLETCIRGGEDSRIIAIKIQNVSPQDFQLDGAHVTFTEDNDCVEMPAPAANAGDENGNGPVGAPIDI